MIEYKVKIDTIDGVKKFVTAASKFAYDIDLISGRYAVDAKSVMGIFSIDTSKVLTMVAHTDDTSELEAALSDFIIN